MRLMVKWNYDIETIRYLLGLAEKENLTIRDLDFLRIVILIKDMDYVKDKLVGKEFAYEDVIKDIAEHDEDKINAIYLSVKEEYDLRVRSLDQEIQQKDMVIAQLEQKVITLQQSDDETGSRDIGPDKKRGERSFVGPVPEAGPLWKRFNRKLFKRGNRDRVKEKLLIAAIKTEGFTVQQLELLEFAARAGVSAKEFMQMAQPTLSLIQMHMLCKIFFTRHGIQLPIPQIEDTVCGARDDEEGKQEEAHVNASESASEEDTIFDEPINDEEQEFLTEEGFGLEGLDGMD